MKLDSRYGLILKRWDVFFGCLITKMIFAQAKRV